MSAGPPAGRVQIRIGTGRGAAADSATIRTEAVDKDMSEAEHVRKSLGRCVLKGDIIGRFYEVFLESHRDIKPRFADTDFDAQRKLLRQGLNLVIMFARGNPLGRQGLARIRESHNQSGLNVPPALYPYWKQSLIQAVSELDPEWSDELQREWELVLQAGIDHITEGYEG